MHQKERRQNDPAIKEAIQNQALLLGADCVGFVPARDLINCPSAVADGYQGSEREHGSYIILGLSHDRSDPELDLWEEDRGTPGDQHLAAIGKALSAWLEETYGISASVIPYQLFHGGIYLKDAACMAGLGIMGRSNLVLVKGFDAQIRFRAVWINLDTTTTSPLQPDTPCTGCPGHCIDSCPMNALEEGIYSREKCFKRMNSDKASGCGLIEHCRACELSCPGWDAMET
ncbi:MAG: hypothetical protein D5R99_07430 [Methanocalculus sp. MSAO_Arc1]|uniref:hypothetical protein n=1 Tax=Methanocalculus TaxID=71151 RepID=UPI000FF843BC|nr:MULTISPECIES: hypothetical protein [unclassified Methanocalculus]MCP1662523.1 NAD-dependent dihydropyrimidine dehydrogenase PreA subunit [Methanocalculus sp. AMF5]RQD79683.1 MAG: hypothetical protein D5R99_07430 [Methanocalculus sp. MSAO_Arc1]